MICGKGKDKEDKEHWIRIKNRKRKDKKAKKEGGRQTHEGEEEKIWKVKRKIRKIPINDL